MIDGWSRKNIKKCVTEVNGVLELFADGYVEFVQWTSEGWLEFKATPLGAENIGLNESEIYRSTIGQGS
jgi:hypothetical protein